MGQRLETALADLLIMHRLRRRGIRFRPRTGGLIIQLEAADDRVRSWPENSYKTYSGRLPINEPWATPAEDAEAEETRAADELLGIAEGLGVTSAGRFPIIFTRFAAAYTALHEWEPSGGNPTPTQQDNELENAVRLAIKKARNNILPRLRQAVRRAGEDAYVQARGGGFVGFLIRVGGVFVPPHRRTMRWYKKTAFDERLSNDRAVITRLRQAREEPLARRELLLAEALLADINAHYGLFRRFNRARLPMILLPGVDRVQARRRARDALLFAYDGKARHLRTYPVVIATSAPDGPPSAAESAERGVRPNSPIPADSLIQEIPELFKKREEVAEKRHTSNTPLPSRLVRASLTAPGDEEAKPTVGGRLGPVTLTALVVAAVMVLSAGGAYARSWASGCGQNLEVAENHNTAGPDDCIGVSDGSGVFMPQVNGMSEVFDRIKAENERIRGQRHATVALMVPMQSDEPAVQRQIVSEVQGAYIAQFTANREGEKPLIRLVIANPGRGYRHWEKTLRKLVEQERDLRAVTGFNLSLDTTKNAIAELTRNRKIPVVAGLVTSDDFANPENAKPSFPGLARVVSTATDQARALLQANPDLVGEETALVADTRPGDIYNNSLRAAFTQVRREKKKGVGVQDMTVRSPGLEVAGYTVNKFESIALNLCQSNARYVYFAGRAYHLKLFALKLADTYCAAKKSYTVVTGSDATTFGSRLTDGERMLLRGDPGGGKPSVSVLYAAPAHPDAWDVEVDRWRRGTRDGVKPGQGLPPYLGEQQDAQARLRRHIEDAKMGEVNLEDGRTMITHDVVLTAKRALAEAARVYETEVPTTEQVRDSFADLNSSLRIRGASGWICLTNAGNPYNKALAVVRWDPASGRLKFDRIAWPEGAPTKDCVVPQQTP